MTKKRILSFILCISLVLSLLSFNAMAEEDLIDFVVTVESGRDVKVLQLTDPQIIDSDQMRTSDRLSGGEISRWASGQKENQYKQYLRVVIPRYNPDLIIITGDLVYGEFDDSGASFTDLVEFMDSFGIPWAPVFGNHDNESAMGVDWQCQQLVNSQYCLFKQRTLTGNGNYTVGIKQDNTVKRVFFMLDSNGCSSMSSATRANGHTTSDQGFKSDQISWYTNQAGLIKDQYPNVKLSFAFHIQPLVFADALAKYGYPTVPINLDRVGDSGDFGYIGRKLKGGFDDSYAVWNGIKSLGADSIFVGHEHCNSGSFMYQGVRLQYGQKSSTYDRLNYFNSSGEILNNDRSSGNTPLVGGTAIELDKTDGGIVNPHIEYYIEPPSPQEEIEEPDPEVYFPVSWSQTTKIEGEAYTGATVTPNIRVMNNPDDGQRAVNYTSFTPSADNEYITSYYLKADLAGYYDLSAVASIRSQTYTSDWSFYVNTADNAVSTYTQGESVTTTKYYVNVFKKFSCGKIYLKKGINTLYWKVNKSDAPDGKLQAALDYFELTPPTVFSVSAEEPTRIEGENYTGTTHSSVATGSLYSIDGVAVNGAKITNVDETTSVKYNVSYIIGAPKAGYYGIKAAGSLRQNNLSEWTIYVNDTSNAVSSYTAAGELFRVNGIGSNAGDVYDCGTVYLNEGINTRYWSFGKAKSQNKIYAALDYIELTPPLPLLSIADVMLSDGLLTAELIKGETLESAARACIAVYGNDGIRSIDLIDVSAGKGTQNISNRVTTTGADEVRIFVWYTENMKPLCPPEKIYIE